ncbi:hypothetical protein EH165_04435 [Nakamurella antarctica]|uniref:Uncharacterized protein n=1 Tax=Nakamurella antarctica TaxID=1902245 RepID=A0A3G8ZJY4_9ACTN|nr:hypothetical protein [Nakamurella antarctica]AZI57520.1 hypothetical protein EH165_04435 [Nakamurella antarctica]
MAHRPKSGPRSATEIMAEVAERLRSDPEFRAAQEQAASDRSAARAALDVALRPVVEDLRSAGLDVDSVWDLHKIPGAISVAFPVLMDHLQRDYPDRALQDIATALQHNSARLHWVELRELYLSSTRTVIQDGVAGAMSLVARREHYPDLLTFLKLDRLGTSRIYFLRPVNRIGNRISAGLGRAVVEPLAHDPQLGIEATAILQGRGPNQ